MKRKKISHEHGRRRHPKIGIVFGKKEENSDRDYQEAIRKSGGEPVLLRPGTGMSGDEDFSSFLGLLLTGGGDIDPSFYGEKKELYCHEPDRERDEFELKILQEFVGKQKPVLAICRGMQVLNVMLGGTLYQDLPAQHSRLSKAHETQESLTRGKKRSIRHPIQIKKGSLLHRLCGETREVNSRHHQAIKKAAPQLEATAEAEDGVIEGVESKGKPWIVGVQWHPESREMYDQFARLFQEFVFQCKP